MKVKTWKKVSMTTMLLAIAYTTFALVLPTVFAGVVVGLICITVNAGLILWMQHLISRGQGEEHRP